jgi:hypothetical protein
MQRFPNASNRLESLYSLFGTSLARVESPEDASLLKNFCDGLFSDDLNIRLKAAEEFKTVSVANAGLKVYVDMEIERALLRISQMPDPQLTGMIPVLRALLVSPVRLSSHGRDHSFQIAKRLLQSDDRDVRTYGFEIVEGNEITQGSEMSHIAHLAINLCRANEFDKVRVKNLLKNLEPYVDKEAQSAITEFLQPTEGD